MQSGASCKELRPVYVAKDKQKKYLTAISQRSFTFIFVSISPANVKYDSDKIFSSDMENWIHTRQILINNKIQETIENFGGDQGAFWRRTHRTDVYTYRQRMQALLTFRPSAGDVPRLQKFSSL